MLWIYQVGNFGRQETIKYIKKKKKVFQLLKLRCLF